VIVGQYDVLFNLSDLTTKGLPPVFNTQQPVISDVVYGSFQSQTAREIFTPTASHLFESIDASVILEVADWMQNSLRITQHPNSVTNLIYFEREVVNLIILIALLCLIFLALLPMTKMNHLRLRKGIPNSENNISRKLKKRAVWGGLNVVLFLPMAFIGTIISFPPLIFGSAIAWWLLAVGLIGLCIKSREFLTSHNKESSIKMRFIELFNRNDVLIALTFFGSLFIAISLLEVTFTINIRIISPVFRTFTSTRRALVFPTFLPFFLFYFIAEASYLHDHDDSNIKQGKMVGIKGCLEAIFWKIMPFVAIIALLYLPKALFNIWILPSFVGFLIEFFWIIIPIFVMTTTFSWWFYRHTNGTMTGILFNTLILAWIAASVFPF
jgi:hypothetical protein